MTVNGKKISTGEKIAAAVLYTVGFAVAFFAVVAIFIVSCFGAVSAVVGLFGATSHVGSAIALAVCCLVAAAMCLYCMVLIFRCVVAHFPGKDASSRGK